jgi:hypothetical protein
VVRGGSTIGGTKKYTITTPAYTANVIANRPVDYGFYPDFNTGRTATDGQGNPVIACHEEEIGIGDAARLRAMFEEDSGDSFRPKKYMKFLTHYIGLDGDWADDLVALVSFHRVTPRASLRDAQYYGGHG